MSDEWEMCSYALIFSRLNILLFIKVKILMLNKWSYRSPNYVDYWNFVQKNNYHDLSMQTNLF